MSIDIHVGVFDQRRVHIERVVVARHGKGCGDAHTVGAIGGGRTVDIPSWMLQSLLVGKSGKLITKQCLTSLVLAYLLASNSWHMET